MWPLDENQGLSQFHGHGHGPWLMCEVAFSLLLEWGGDEHKFPLPLRSSVRSFAPRHLLLPFTPLTLTSPLLYGRSMPLLSKVTTLMIPISAC